jgi:hypothetical protein
MSNDPKGNRLIVRKRPTARLAQRDWQAAGDVWLECGLRPAKPRDALLFPASPDVPLVPAPLGLVSQRFGIRAKRYGCPGFAFRGLPRTDRCFSREE